MSSSALERLIECETNALLREGADPDVARHLARETARAETMDRDFPTNAMTDPRPFVEVFNDWLDGHKLPAYKLGKLMRVSSSTTTRWRKGEPCTGETAVRALMVLIDEMECDERAIARALGEGIPFRVALQKWMDGRRLNVAELGRMLDEPTATVWRWLNTQPCRLERAMRARMYMIDEGRA